jgi:hypothetical protein
MFKEAIMLARQISEEIKYLIKERYPEHDVREKIHKKYGDIDQFGFWYQCCYNSVCVEMGIDLKHGEKLKPKKVRLKTGKVRK